MLKILQARRQQCEDQECPDVQAGLAKEPEIKLPTSVGSYLPLSSHRPHLPRFPETEWWEKAMFYWPALTECRTFHQESILLLLFLPHSIRPHLGTHAHCHSLIFLLTFLRHSLSVWSSTWFVRIDKDKLQSLPSKSLLGEHFCNPKSYIIALTKSTQGSFKSYQC